MTRKLQTYEVLASMTYSMRLRVKARSPQLAGMLIEDGEWDDTNEIDSECHDVIVCSVTLAPESGQAKEA